VRDVIGRELTFAAVCTKFCYADFPAVRCGGSVCAAIARAFGMMGGKRSLAAGAKKLPTNKYADVHRLQDFGLAAKS